METRHIDAADKYVAARVVYGKAAGNAVVTATVDNKTASCAIVVEDVKCISNARLEASSKKPLPKSLEKFPSFWYTIS